MTDNRVSSVIDQWAQLEARRIRVAYGTAVEVTAIELKGPDEILLRLWDPAGRGAPGVVRLGELEELSAEVFFSVELFSLPTGESRPRWRNFLWSSDCLYRENVYFVHDAENVWVPLETDGIPALAGGLECLVRGTRRAGAASRRRPPLPYGRPACDETN